MLSATALQQVCGETISIDLLSLEFYLVACAIAPSRAWGPATSAPWSSSSLSAANLFRTLTPFMWTWISGLWTITNSDKRTMGTVSNTGISSFNSVSVLGVSSRPGMLNWYSLFGAGPLILQMQKTTPSTARPEHSGWPRKFWHSASDTVPWNVSVPTWFVTLLKSVNNSTSFPSVRLWSSAVLLLMIQASQVIWAFSNAKN